MLSREQDYIAEALDEIRDEYIDEAVVYAGQLNHDVGVQDEDKIAAQKPNGTDGMETALVSVDELKKKSKKRKFNTTFGAIAACLVFVVVLGTYQQFGGGYGSSAPAGNGDPAGGASMEQSADATVDETGGTSGADGSSESGSISDLELGDPGNASTEGADGKGNSVGAGGGADAESSVLEGLAIDKDLVITSEFKPETLEGVALRGFVEEVDIVYESDCTYILVSVEATEVYAGDLQLGATYEIWIPADVDNDSTAKSYLAMLERGVKAETEYIFTPYVGESDGRLIAYRKD